MAAIPDKTMLLLEDASASRKHPGRSRSVSRPCCNFFLLTLTICAAVFLFIAFFDLSRNMAGSGSQDRGYSFTSVGVYFLNNKPDEIGQQESTKLQVQQAPPFFWEKAKTARYIVHNNNWGAITTISVDLHGSPFGTMESFCDGPVDNSTGIPYFYLDPRNPTTIDSETNPAASLILSEVESGYCQGKHWDPEDPRCGRVCLSGKIVELTADAEEGAFAKAALFERHPQMKKWPSSHGWKILKLDVTHIWLLDFFGPASTVSVDDYFKVKL